MSERNLGNIGQNLFDGLNTSLTEAEKENKRLKSLLEEQEALLKDQRMVLYQISEKAKKLLNIEEERSAAVKKIQECKNSVKDCLSQSKDITKQVEALVGDKEIDFNTETKLFKLKETTKAVETIQKIVFQASESCFKQGRNSFTQSEVQSIILAINKTIERTIESGAATETIDQEIERYRIVLEATKATSGKI